MKYLYIGLLIYFFTVSCSKNNIIEEACSDQQIVLNDTIGFESSFEPTVYTLDLDCDGIEDGSIMLNLATSIAGNTCSIRFKVSDDSWSIVAKNIPVYICQDTLNWDLDSTVVYYKNYDCDNQDNSIQVDTLQMVEFFQEEHLDIIEHKFEEALLYSYYGVGSYGIFPGAVFNEITCTVFENSKYSGWVVFEKSDSKLYGIEVAIEANIFPCPTLYIRQIKRIDN